MENVPGISDRLVQVVADSGTTTQYHLASFFSHTDLFSFFQIAGLPQSINYTLEGKKTNTVSVTVNSVTVTTRLTVTDEHALTCVSGQDCGCDSL